MYFLLLTNNFYFIYTLNKLFQFSFFNTLKLLLISISKNLLFNYININYIFLPENIKIFYGLNWKLIYKILNNIFELQIYYLNLLTI